MEGDPNYSASHSLHSNQAKQNFEIWGAALQWFVLNICSLTSFCSDTNILPDCVHEGVCLGVCVCGGGVGRGRVGECEWKGVWELFFYKYTYIILFILLIHSTDK